eukprot:Rhum_TRINITY_DN14468_c1_g1::Rhum_TRINITY_DN14468_c1_g1_i1::g.89745::m.89745
MMRPVAALAVVAARRASASAAAAAGFCRRASASSSPPPQQPEGSAAAGISAAAEAAAEAAATTTPSLSHLASAARQEDAGRGGAGAYPKLQALVSGVKATDSLRGVVDGLDAVRDGLPPGIEGFLRCVGEQVALSDMQLSQLCVWLTARGVYAQKVSHFCRVVGAQRHAGHRTLSLLCVHAARGGCVELSSRLCGRLLSLPVAARRAVKWDKVFYASLSAAGFRSEHFEGVLRRLREMGSGGSALFAPLILACVRAGEAEAFERAVAAAESAAYPLDGAEARHHRVLMRLRSPSLSGGEVAELLSGLQAAVQKKADVPGEAGGTRKKADVRLADVFPRLADAVKASALRQAEKSACLAQLGVAAPSGGGGEAAAAADTSGLCREYKLGRCSDAACTLSHRLVRCSAGAACEHQAQCAYVHPDEIAWRWATDETATAAPAEGWETQTPTQQQQQATTPQRAAAAGAKRQAKHERAVRGRAKRFDSLLKRFEGTRRKGAALSAQERKNIHNMQALVDNLQKLEKRRSRSRGADWTPRQPAPAALVSQYPRTDLDDILAVASGGGGKTGGQTAAAKLLEACADEAPAAGPKPQKQAKMAWLPPFDMEEDAAKSVSLLSIVKGARDDAGGRGKKGSAAATAAAGGDSPSSSPSPSRHQKMRPAVPSTESAWFKELSGILK